MRRIPPPPLIYENKGFAFRRVLSRWPSGKIRSGTLRRRTTLPLAGRPYIFSGTLHLYENSSVKNGYLARPIDLHLDGQDLTATASYITFHKNGSPASVITSSETIVVRGTTYPNVYSMRFYSNEKIRHIYCSGYWRVNVGEDTFRTDDIYFDKQTSKITAIDGYKFYLNGTVAQSGPFGDAELLSWNGAGKQSLRKKR